MKVDLTAPGTEFEKGRFRRLWSFGTPAWVMAAATLILGSDATAAADFKEIVVAAEAPPAVVYAAEEFQEFYRRASGVTLPVHSKPAKASGRLFIGAGRVTLRESPPVEIADLGTEDLRIVVANGDAAIAGRSPRGTLYGVYTFLEKRLGVRFLA